MASKIIQSYASQFPDSAWDFMGLENKTVGFSTEERPPIEKYIHDRINQIMEEANA